jgi:hypothetical protein
MYNIFCSGSRAKRASSSSQTSRAELVLWLGCLTSRAEPARFLNEPARFLNEPARARSSRAELARYPPLVAAQQRQRKGLVGSSPTALLAHPLPACRCRSLPGRRSPSPCCVQVVQPPPSHSSKCQRPPSRCVQIVQPPPAARPSVLRADLSSV